MKNLTFTQAILNFSFSTDSGTPTEHLQLVSSKNIHWFRFYDFFSVKFCVDFFLTVSYLTNYPMRVEILKGLVWDYRITPQREAALLHLKFC